MGIFWDGFGSALGGRDFSIFKFASECSSTKLHIAFSSDQVAKPVNAS
jgi:hypothetical protein